MKTTTLLLTCALFWLHADSSYGTELSHEQILLVVKALKSNDENQKKEALALIADRNKISSQLIKILKDETVKKASPKVVGAAIEILGEIQSVEAVDQLAKMLLFHPEIGKTFTLQDFSGPGGNSYGMFGCPAWRALANIGKPSIDPFLDELTKGDEDFINFGSVLGSNIFADVFKLNVQDANDAINRFQNSHKLDKKSIEKLELFKAYINRNFVRIKEDRKRAEEERALKKKSESKDSGS